MHIRKQSEHFLKKDRFLIYWISSSINDWWFSPTKSWFGWWLSDDAHDYSQTAAACFFLTSYLVYGLERLLHQARHREAIGSPWSECKDDGKMVSETDSIIKHSARCAWRISQGIIANCICVNCRFCHFVGLQKPTKTTIPTKLTSVMCSLVVQRLSSPHVQISRIFREQ